MVETTHSVVDTHWNRNTGSHAFSDRVGAGRPQHIPGLDGLRGLAAFTVLIHHAGLLRHQRVGALFTHAFPVGDFLFLLSGFVIGLAYEPMMAEGISLRSFMRVRLGRLYPMILMGSLMGAAVGFFLGFHFSVWLALVAQLALIPFVVSSSEAYPLNNVQWTLFFELFANALHVTTFRVLSTRRLVVVVVLSAAFLIVTVAHFHGIGVGFSLATFWGGFARVIFSYSAGLLVFRAYQAGRMPTIRVPYVAIAVVLVGVIAMPATPWLPDPLIVIVIFPVLLFLAVQAPAPSGILLKFALWAGAISYPLYAIHVSLLKAAFLVAPHTSSTVRAVYWLMTLILIVCFSWATELVYDAPIRRWLRKTTASSGSRISKSQHDRPNEPEVHCS